MLRKLIIKNFRCYENSSVVLQRTSILVGRNNAGKSTLIEALKIVSEVSRKYKTAHCVSPPSWIKDESDNGISPSMDRVNVSSRGLFYMYGEAPAVIEAVFTNKTGLRIYVGEDLSVFAIVIGPNGVPARNSRALKEIDIPSIEVLPQISALQDAEMLLKKETVEYNLSTRLASRNFRNQIYYYNQYFPRFKQMSEDTWEHLQVKPIERDLLNPNQSLQFFVRDNSFESEIGWMGHGLQMWLQTMWFLARCSENSIVVLDEPDVYMHADLQRRLIRLVSPMFSQLIVATHSVEIMEEVTTDCIIPIDSKRRTIKPIGSHELLQKITEEIGSAFNLDLARLFISKRFMIWEGEDTDRQILSAFQSIVSPQDSTPISSFPKIYVEGWGGWQRALAVAALFNQNKIHIKCYCLFDSDYHTQESIKAREDEAVEHHVNLHIWKRKEIENYAIEPKVILRYIQRNKRKGQITELILQDKINQLVANLREKFIEDVAEEFRMENNKLAISTAMAKARERTKSLLNACPLSVLPGKKMLKELSRWSKEKFGVSFNALNLVKTFHVDEIPGEISDVINTIIGGGDFSAQAK